MGLLLYGLSAAPDLSATMALVFLGGYLVTTLVLFVGALSMAHTGPDGFADSKATSGLLNITYTSAVGRGRVQDASAPHALGVVLLIVALCSFAALPPFVGFITKYTLVLHLVRTESIALAL